MLYEINNSTQKLDSIVDDFDKVLLKINSANLKFEEFTDLDFLEKFFIHGYFSKELRKGDKRQFSFALIMIKNISKVILSVQNSFSYEEADERMDIISDLVKLIQKCQNAHKEGWF